MKPEPPKTVTSPCMNLSPVANASSPHRGAAPSDRRGGPCAQSVAGVIDRGEAAPYQDALSPIRQGLAQVAELVDALASGASGLTVVEVRVLSWAPSLS